MNAFLKSTNSQSSSISLHHSYLKMRTKHMWRPATQPSCNKQALLKPESSLSLASFLSGDKKDKLGKSRSLVLSLQHKSKPLASSLWEDKKDKASLSLPRTFLPWRGCCRVTTRRSPSPRCPCRCPHQMSAKVHPACMKDNTRMASEQNFCCSYSLFNYCKFCIILEALLQKKLT